VLKARLIKDVSDALDNALLKGAGTSNSITGLINQDDVQVGAWVPPFSARNGRPTRTPWLDCEPQQARGIPRNLQLDETVAPLALSCPVEVCEFQTYFASDLAKSGQTPPVAGMWISSQRSRQR
jgi:hypothetical protein